MIKIKNLSRIICSLIVLTVLPGAASADQNAALYRDYAAPLTKPDDLAPLLSAAQDKKLVLLGESSHGTSEFYSWRAEISRRLIEQGGFSFVAVEGDWTTLARLNRYIKHKPDAPESARAALLESDRWPRWMWANEEFADFAEWLRGYNKMRQPAHRTGLYGMDVYATWDALDQLLNWYAAHHPEKKQTVRAHYELFASHREDARSYLEALHRGADGASGPAAALEKTKTLWQQAEAPDRNQAFFAKQAAHVVMAGEAFYRLMNSPGPASWNVRAGHMHETVGRLLDLYGPESKGIVWAHNTHIGDARATDMAHIGQHNIGQLARQSHGKDNVYLIGFTTYSGEVMAGRQWEAPRQVMNVPAAPADSFEAALKNIGQGDLLLQFPPPDQRPEALSRVIGHRAIGVVYNPEMDLRQYVPTIPARRYNAMIYIEETQALRPLHEHE